jgi:hypothetical protein
VFMWRREAIYAVVVTSPNPPLKLLVCSLRFWINGIPQGQHRIAGTAYQFQKPNFGIQK